MVRVEGITDSMREAKGAPIRVLRVQALPGLVLGYLSRRLYEFQERYPGITLELVVNDRVIDPVAEGFDVALQIFPPASELLIERRIFPLRRLFVASKTYLERFGSPRSPQDLLKHRLGLYDRYPTRNRWVFRRDEEVIELQLRPTLKSNSVHLLCDYACSDAGIVCIPTITAAEHLLAGRLLPVVPDYHLSSFTLSAVYPATHRHTLKVKLFVEFVAAHFAGEPAWDNELAKAGFKLPPASPA